MIDDRRNKISFFFKYRKEIEIQRFYARKHGSRDRNHYFVIIAAFGAIFRFKYEIDYHALDCKRK